MANHSVRRAHAGEAGALTDLIYRAKQSNGYDDVFMAACTDELRVTEEDIARDGIWVIGDTSLLGCATLTASAEHGIGEVSAFFIDPNHHRRGIGRALWEHLYHAAHAHGWARLRLDADPAAVPFYETLGFVIIGTNPSGSIPGRVLPMMEYDLTKGL